MAQAEEMVTVQVGPQGRVVIPAELRRRWKLETGEVLIARLENDALVLERRAQVIERIRQQYAHLRSQPSLVDELIANRRREAARENEDAK